MINKEALEYLVGLGLKEDVLVDTEKGLFSKIPLTRIRHTEVSTLKVSTLTSLIEFIVGNIDNYKDKYLIHVASPSEVRLLTPLLEDGNRDEMLRAVAILPSNIYYSSFISTEQFNIMLQSSFDDKGDKEMLLRFVGLIRDEQVKETGDDGISQKATIKTGVTTVGEAVVPNPVVLAPYRTFPEIDQVESSFIFRMKEGPTAALFEADGGMWRNEIMSRIQHYLNMNLEGLTDKYEIIS